MLKPEQIVNFEREATSTEWPEWCSDDDARDRFARAIYARGLKDAAAVCDLHSESGGIAQLVKADILALGEERQ